MLYALDIETECSIGCTSSCDHGLDPWRSNITVVAVANDKEQLIFRDLSQLKEWLELNKPRLTMQNGKFDTKHLLIHGVDVRPYWEHDSQLLAFLYQTKIPESWLASYEARRMELNKTRKGVKHRPASLHSLKTLAPFFLGVEPFWEADSHNNDEYALKDALYTYRLTLYFINALKIQGDKSYKFYKDKLLPWTKNLMQMELDGIAIDLPLLTSKWNNTEKDYFDLHALIREQWKEHFTKYAQMQRLSVFNKYADMEAKAKSKGRWSAKIAARHELNKTKALSHIEELNLDSPLQLKWLLSELGLEAVNLEGEESTNKETLNRLSEEDSSVGNLLKYRKTKKLLTSFFPDYQERAVNGVMHTNFNSTGARTGRLSSSSPNLQQVPGHLHDLFVAKEGNVLVTRDLSAIEPTMIAFYSEDKELCNLMLNKGDFHGTNAAVMFSLDCEPSEVKKKFHTERQIAKTVGLAVLYGAGARRVHQTLMQAGKQEFTQDDCKEIVNRIRSFYEGVWQFKQQLDKELERGYVIYNYLGRPLKISNIDDVYMTGLNTLIQSSASDLLQQAALDIRNLGYSPKLLVHDEMVVEVPASLAERAEADIVREMTKFELQTAYGLIPIRTEGKVAKSWEK
jgi:DNA polymerase-1